VGEVDTDEFKKPRKESNSPGCKIGQELLYYYYWIGNYLDERLV
jgi:hypothetical protein